MAWYYHLVNGHFLVKRVSKGVLVAATAIWVGDGGGDDMVIVLYGGGVGDGEVYGPVVAITPGGGDEVAATTRSTSSRPCPRRAARAGSPRDALLGTCWPRSTKAAGCEVRLCTEPLHAAGGQQQCRRICKRETWSLSSRSEMVG